ncbi:hypothetical protein LCGC14_3025580 [marine sediment metagenome]|uniref:Uncharacterized protein n=1 Tax=marine sediment metagenome TaxID=412755 RepID=A0A0F8ZK33_9ZZZZ
MFRKRKAPPPNPQKSLDPFGLQAFAATRPSFGLGGAGGTPGLPPPQPVSSIALNSGLSLSALRAQVLGIYEEKLNPEPKEEPKTAVGLTGYRLYTLDNELYLRGAQGSKQKGRESAQAQHNGDDVDYVTMERRSIKHPAPAWECLCGFAAFFWPTSLTQPKWNGVLAEVQAGGRTIYCEEGWRAERIVLSKLWVSCPIFPDAALEILRERYEVPVELL